MASQSPWSCVEPFCICCSWLGHRHTQEPAHVPMAQEPAPHSSLPLHGEHSWGTFPVAGVNKSLWGQVTCRDILAASREHAAPWGTGGSEQHRGPSAASLQSWRPGLSDQNSDFAGRYKLSH